MLSTVDSHFCSILCCWFWTMFWYGSLPHLYFQVLNWHWVWASVLRMTDHISSVEEIWLCYFRSVFLCTVAYQLEMMKNLRHVNIDHLHVGWYQSTNFGTYINKALVDSQFNYQFSIEESIVLIYGNHFNQSINQFIYRNSRLPVRQESIELAAHGRIHTIKPQLYEQIKVR